MTCTSTQETGNPPFRPLFARVLIWRDVQEKTASGIILPSAKKYAPAKGVIKALGPTADGLEIGQTVIFGKYAGTWLDENGMQLNPDEAETSKGWFICADEDIICVVVD